MDLICPNPVDEALRLASLPDLVSTQAQIVGGIAIWLTCPSARRRPLGRYHRDIDLAAPQSELPIVSNCLEVQGYTPDLAEESTPSQVCSFWDRKHGRMVDVFAKEGAIDDPGSGRIASPRSLLARKLRNSSFRTVDSLDVLALLLDHPLDGPQRSVTRMGRRHLGLTDHPADPRMLELVLKNLTQTMDFARQYLPTGPIRRRLISECGQIRKALREGL